MVVKWFYVLDTAVGATVYLWISIALTTHPHKHFSMSRTQLFGWWVGILGVHGAAACFYIATSVFYWRLALTDLQGFFSYFRIGMGEKHNHAVALIHAACALPHAFCALGMIGATLKSRRLIFQIIPDPYPKRKARSRRRAQTFSASQTTKFGLYVKDHSSRALDGVFAFVSVSGRYYDVALVVHELVETLLHTVQAYKMSRLLPRVTTNRMYVVFIVLNCWLTVLLRTIYAKRVANERLFSLFCDCVLDLVISIGAIGTIAKSYVADYDWSTGGFPHSLWVNDRWLAYAINELQIVVVSSWTDLTARAVFACGALVALSDIKSILSAERSSTRIDIAPSVIKPIGPTAGDLVKPQMLVALRERSGSRLLDFIETNSGKNHLISKGVKIAFGAWGLAVLSLHIQAESLPAVHCMQVRPWGATRPYCSFVDVSCERLQISGYSHQIESMWERIGFATVERIRLCHCPHLEFPTLLQKFSSLHSLKVYNSTIDKWDDNAAIKQTAHPHLAYLLLIRVTFSNGSLPLGILSPEIPSSLREITICASNLKQVPDNLDTIWPKGITIFLELGLLSSVPGSIIRLKPSALSLYGNSITSLPSSLFEIDDIDLLDIGGMHVYALPERVDAPSPSLKLLFLPDTSVSVFHKWVDEVVPSLIQLVASGAPYCDAYERIQNGSATQFPLNSASNASLSTLMDAEIHWDTISRVVSCDPARKGPFYPLAANDVAASE